jgi:hypothetical protein
LGSFDSIEDDSIFSLGKIVLSPRYSQYPDLRPVSLLLFYTWHKDKWTEKTF